MNLSHSDATLTSSREPVFLVTELLPPEGYRVAEIGGLASGFYVLRAEALDVGARVVVSREVHLVLDGSQLLPVVLSAACAGVACPTGARPEATTCLGGVCVEPTCSPLGNEAAHAV